MGGDALWLVFLLVLVFGDRAFRSQELRHGMRYRPVSPPRRLSLSLHSDDF